MKKIFFTIFKHCLILNSNEDTVVADINNIESSFDSDSNNEEYNNNNNNNSNSNNIISNRNI